ncbi:MAG: TrkA C-terminal domain-containing protein, partial [Pseudomonadota bacterium]
ENRIAVSNGEPTDASLDRVIIPHHDTLLEAGDHVVVFCSRKRQVPEVEKLFQVGFNFL